jgi:hypothetical protein
MLSQHEQGKLTVFSIFFAFILIGGYFGLNVHSDTDILSALICSGLLAERLAQIVARRFV